MSQYSKIGWLASGANGNTTGINDLFVQPLAAAGRPVVAMCNDGDRIMADMIATGKLDQMVAVGRVVKDGTEYYSVPDYDKTPQAAALEHWAKIRPFFNPTWEQYRDHIWIQPVNEVDHERSDWLGFFGVEIAKIAKVEGFKVCLFAFSSGEPEPEDWFTDGMIAYLEYCEANPDQAAVALHEYDLLMQGFKHVDVWGWHIGRFKFLFDACDQMGLARPKVLITEFGWQLDNIPDFDQWLADISNAAQLYAQYTDVLGAGIWYLGGGWNGIANKLQALFDDLAAYNLAAEFPDPEEPPGGNGDPVNSWINGDMEGGYYEWTDPAGNPHDNIRIPAGSNFGHATANNPPNPVNLDPANQFKQPEAHILNKHTDLPPAEWEDFVYDGDRTWKIFGDWKAIRFYLEQNGKAAGFYDVSLYIFPDMYKWQGGKVFGTDPDSCHVWVETDKETTAVIKPLPGQGYNLTFEDVEVGENGYIRLWFMGPFAFQNNGFWIDGLRAYPVETPGNGGGITIPDHTVKHTIHWFPQAITEAAVLNIVKTLHPTRSAFTYSHDVVHAILWAGTGESKVIVWGPEMHPGGEAAVLQFFEDVGIVNYEFKEIPGSSPGPGFNVTAWPVNSSVNVSQCFGARPSIYAPFGLPGHDGIDIPASVGAIVDVMADGTVIQVENNPNPDPKIDPLGKLVRVQHAGGYVTTYAHLKEATATAGQTITAGSQIGTVGLTGNTSGPHLHIQLKRPGFSYTDASGKIWPFNIFNLWPFMETTYKPEGRTMMQGWVYNPYLTAGSDGEAVNFGSNLNMRSGPGSGYDKIASVPSNTLINISDTIQDSYRFVTCWAIAEGGNPGVNVDMANYFFPGSGDFGDIAILENNWSGGQERQQLQRVGEISYVTKNSQWERRLVGPANIYLQIDTSPGSNQYYTVTGEWLPRFWKPGDVFTRYETVQFFYKSGLEACQPTTNPYTAVSDMRFAALIPTYTSPVGGIQLSNVIKLEWLIGGAVEETYHYAPGLGLIEWQNKAGLHSYVVDLIFQGQQEDNERESGCFG